MPMLPLKGALGALRTLAKEIPSGMTAAEWRGLVGNVTAGNRDLARILHMPDFAHVEVGGWATPQRKYPTVTQMEPHSVDPGANPSTSPHAVVFHSHPYSVTDDRFQLPSPLSAQDIRLLTDADLRGRGITSLEPHGGFGYALKSARAVPIGYRDPVWDDAITMARGAAGKHPMRPRFFPPDESGETPETALIGALALARALKRRGWLEMSGYIPGTAAQARTLEAYGPAIREGTRAAESMLRHHLGKDRLGALLLAALTGAGGAGVLGALANREAAA